jgi:hypothetical protein
MSVTDHDAVHGELPVDVTRIQVQLAQIENSADVEVLAS